MSTYNATVTREGKWWMVAVPEVGLTQARRLSEVELMAKELIAVTLDIPLSTVTVNISVESVGDVKDLSKRVRELEETRRKAAKLEEQASAQTVSLAKELAASEVPLRDMGVILGLSHQRAHQLLAL